jgi:hypothetical protein
MPSSSVFSVGNRKFAGPGRGCVLERDELRRAVAEHVERAPEGIETDVGQCDTEIVHHVAEEAGEREARSAGRKIAFDRERRPHGTVVAPETVVAEAAARRLRPVAEQRAEVARHRNALVEELRAELRPAETRRECVLPRDQHQLAARVRAVDEVVCGGGDSLDAIEKAEEDGPVRGEREIPDRIEWEGREAGRGRTGHRHEALLATAGPPPEAARSVRIIRPEEHLAGVVQQRAVEELIRRARSGRRLEAQRDRLDRGDLRGCCRPSCDPREHTDPDEPNPFARSTGSHRRISFFR